MQYRRLGNTGIDVSALAFGAGPVPALLTGGDAARQRAVVARAVELGVNWFDTAATYGEGRSEEALGGALAELDLHDRIQLATKVRLLPDQLDHINRHVKDSVARSLRRLRAKRVTLLQLHNSVTARRGDEPTSLTPADILGPGGVAEAFDELTADGAVRFVGLTGIGQPAALREVIASGRFHSIQIPYNVLNPSAGSVAKPGFAETDYGNVIAACAAHEMGVFAIRVYAGGALVGQPPSEHTKVTKFFPLELYLRDQRRAAELAEMLEPLGLSPSAAALRFVLNHHQITSAIVGFGALQHVDEAIAHVGAGSLPCEIHERLTAWSQCVSIARTDA